MAARPIALNSEKVEEYLRQMELRATEMEAVEAEIKRNALSSQAAGRSAGPCVSDVAALVQETEDVAALLRGLITAAVSHVNDIKEDLLRADEVH
jgi:hypothetical protein